MVGKIEPRLSRKIGQAMHDYQMFKEGDRVLVAVSGGIDSMVLAFLLHFWQKKAPIRFEVVYLHVDHGFWQAQQTPEKAPEETIGSQLQRISAHLEIEPEWDIEEDQRSCYLCARNRRNLLFDYARKKNFTKIAFGHHKDDLVETFMLNILYSGNISTMRPKQKLFSGNLSIVRPMAYLDKKEVRQLGEDWSITPVKNFCHLSDDTKRETVRTVLQHIYSKEPDAKKSLFASLSNVRTEYLL